MSKPASKPKENLLGLLVQPSQGVETREVASRRGELGFYKAQQLGQYDRQDA